jgi:NAD(P)-dependent dehydrogenase (short-subunit alcohol dehydrogenase family)
MELKAADQLRDKVCLVTGANAGIGKALALDLAKSGATIVMVCRDQTRGAAAQADIQRESGNDAVELLLADLSALAAVRSLATMFKAKYSKLDVLINNAAVYLRTRTLTPDGLETMFATNHLAPFLLTNLLLDSLQAGGAARVVNITAPSTAKIDFDNLQGEQRFSSLSAFGATKMGNLLFTFNLARRLDGRAVTVNAVHPGLVKSNLMHEAPAPLRWVTGLISANPDRAVEPIVRLAYALEYAGQTGRFYRNGKPITAHAYAYDQDIQRRLWNVSAQLVGLSN